MDDTDLFNGNGAGFAPQVALQAKGVAYAEIQSRLQWGKVVARHPETGTMDVAISQGGTLREVPVSGPWLSNTAGQVYQPHHDLAAPLPSTGGVWDIPIASGKTDLWAIVGFVQSSGQQTTPNSPIILGFLPDRDGQMVFTTPGLAVWRHESGVYHVTYPTVGQHDEWHWPDGSALVVGTDTTPATMTNENAAWAPPTTSTPAQVTFTHASGARLTIDPSGNVAVSAAPGKTLTFNGGTKGVARIGDTVSVSGSDSAGDTFTATGTITSASTTVLSG